MYVRRGRGDFFYSVTKRGFSAQSRGPSPPQTKFAWNTYVRVTRSDDGKILNIYRKCWSGEFGVFIRLFYPGPNARPHVVRIAKVTLKLDVKKACKTNNDWPRRYHTMNINVRQVKDETLAYIVTPISVELHTTDITTRRNTTRVHDAVLQCEKSKRI